MGDSAESLANIKKKKILSTTQPLIPSQKAIRFVKHNFTFINPC